MPRDAPQNPERLPLEVLIRIDHACDRFEEGLRRGESLSIEELTMDLGGLERQQLLLQLLKLDLEYRCPDDLETVEAEYCRRFPLDRAVVRKAIQKQREFERGDAPIASFITFAAAESPMPISHPDGTLEEYDLLEEIGRGGMGVVYRARHRESARVFAIKMLLTGARSTDDQIRRFHREARTASKLEHPHIVAVHDSGFCNGAPYFVMDYVDGLDLETLAQNSPLTQMEAAILIKKAAGALHYAHSHEVVHRDIKPSNLLLDEEVRLRITDFGLARELSQGDTLTQSGSVMGTPAYMPPEQALANRKLIGPRSDVYSLGAVLFFLLTGRPPFQGNVVVRVLHQVVTARPPNPRSLNNSISDSLSSICLKCLEKNPDRRYQSAAELAEDLERWQRMKPVAAAQPAIQSLERKLTPEKSGLSSKWITLSAAMICLLVAALLMIPPRQKRGDPETGMVGSEKGVNGSETDTVITGGSQGGIGDQSGGDGGGGPGPPPPPQSFIAQGIELDDTHNVAYSAVPSQPFGIGKISFKIRHNSWEWYRDQPARVFSREAGQIYYPSFKFESSTEAGAPSHLTAWFLIPDPKLKEMHIGLDFELPEEITLRPEETTPIRDVKMSVTTANAANVRTLREEWWEAMLANRLQNDQSQTQLVPSADMQVVNMYFLEMLQRRWNRVLNPSEQLKIPNAPTSSDGPNLKIAFEKMVGVLLGFESIQLAMMELNPEQTDDPATKEVHEISPRMRLPAPNFSRAKLSSPEPLALQVPKYCFYLHCRSIKNYLWLRDVVQGWGGSMDEIVTVPAIEKDARKRIEKQLVFDPYLAMDGGIDNLIDDCALIGLDPYFQDGAGVGIVFQAKPDRGAELSELLEKQRQQVQNQQDVTSDTPKIAGATVHFLFTDQYRVRSYYLKSGHYHLITNSKTLADEFLATSQNVNNSLGRLTEYQVALTTLKNQSGYSAVLYVPVPFIRNITSPEYVIEVERRRKAVREFRKLSLAFTAAKSEGVEIDSIRDLKGTFLETDFGQRSVEQDRSTLDIHNSLVYDNLRGYPGTFLPIADNPISLVTESEVEAYKEYQTAYEKQWSHAQPVLLTFSTEKDKRDNSEKVIVDVRLTRFAQTLFRSLAELLPDEPDTNHIAMPPNELLSITFKGKAGKLTPHFYAGIVDDEIEYQYQHGELVRKGKYEKVEFAEQNYYLLATPNDKKTQELIFKLITLFKQENLVNVSALSHFFGGGGSSNSRIFSSGAIPALMTGNPLLMIPSLFGGSSPPSDKPRPNRPQKSKGPIVLAKDGEIKSRIQDNWRYEKTSRPAHFLLQLRDVEQSRVLDYLEAFTFLEGRRMSAADTAVMNRMAVDLNLSPEDVRSRLEEILGGDSELTDLRCPVGGVYETTLLNQQNIPEKGPGPAQNPEKQEFRYWRSTGWQEPSLYLEKEKPENYSYPFLNWVKSFLLESTIEKETHTLTSHLELALREPPESAGSSIIPPPSPEEPGGSGPDPPRFSGPVLKIVNTDPSPINFRHRKLRGTWSSWQTLISGAEARFQIEQTLELEYRVSGNAKSLLAGSVGTLEVRRDRWDAIK